MPHWCCQSLRMCMSPVVCGDCCFGAAAIGRLCVGQCSESATVFYSSNRSNAKPLRGCTLSSRPLRCPVLLSCNS